MFAQNTLFQTISKLNQFLLLVYVINCFSGYMPHYIENGMTKSKLLYL